MTNDITETIGLDKGPPSGHSGQPGKSPLPRNERVNPGVPKGAN